MTRLKRVPKLADPVWFDTHAHLQDPRYREDLAEVLQRAYAAGVRSILLATSDLADSRTAAELVLQWPAGAAAAAAGLPELFCSIGCHPHEADSWTDQSAGELTALYHEIAERAAESGRINPIRAVGEIGLDYYYDLSPRQKQQTVYRCQIELAHELSLPLIVHEREAFRDSFDILSEAAENGRLRPEPGVAHCFSGSQESADLLMNLGFLLGFDGPLTFANARKAPDIVAGMPPDRLLLETDSPYLTPVPYRGKRNESSYLPLIGQKAAELRGAEAAQIADQTTRNARRLFGLEASA